MKKYKVLCALFLVITLLAGCSRYSSQPATITDTVFDTVISIQIYDKDSDEVLNTCVQMCRDYEKLFSRTLEGSDIYRINHAEGKAVEVSDETIKLLNLALKYCDLSEGAFDITLGGVSDLWKFTENPEKAPKESNINKELQYTGYKKIRIDGNVVQLANSKMQIDLGAIAKGYVADRLKEYLKNEGIRHALINLGGNVLGVGGKPGQNKFNIGIQKPFDETGAAIASVKVEDESVVTSGIYQRYFKVGDKLYHHILDPDTGYPCESSLLSVTIVAESSAQADALSTLCFTMGYKGGMRFINNMENVEALFITDDYELHYSNGFPK